MNIRLHLGKRAALGRNSLLAALFSLSVQERRSRRQHRRAHSTGSNS